MFCFLWKIIKKSPQICGDFLFYSFCFFVSLIVIITLAASTNTEPKTILNSHFSSSNHIPTTTPVIGSNVLSIAVFSPPIINAPFWNNTTAPVVTNNAKSAQSNQPLNDCGNKRLFVETQRTNVIMLLQSAT